MANCLLLLLLLLTSSGEPAFFQAMSAGSGTTRVRCWLSASWAEAHIRSPASFFARLPFLPVQPDLLTLLPHNFGALVACLHMHSQLTLLVGNAPGVGVGEGVLEEGDDLVHLVAAAHRDMTGNQAAVYGESHAAVLCKAALGLSGPPEHDMPCSSQQQPAVAAHSSRR